MNENDIKREMKEGKLRQRITELEKESFNSEIRYNKLLQSIPMTIYEGNKNWETISVNPYIENITGYTEEEFMNQEIKWSDLIHPEDKDEIIKESSKITEQQGTIIQVYRIIKKNGSISWVEDKKSSKFKDNKFISLHGIIQDISERKHMTKLLHEREAQLLKAQEIAHMGFLDWNLKTDDIFLSDQVIKMFKLDPLKNWVTPELLTKVSHPDDINYIQENLELAIEGAIEYDIDHRIILPDGNFIWVHSQAELTFDENGNPERLLGTVIDITERKRLEEEKVLSQKFESLGLIAGGIAHDFNNILVSMLGNIELIQYDHKLDKNQKEFMEELQSATLRASKLTKQLLTFSKGGKPVTEVQSIKPVIENTVSFTMRGSNSKYSVHYHETPPFVCIDEAQIEQVINNLVLNAIQSMPSGGSIVIEVKSKFMENQSLLKEGNYVEIQIKDQGTGIPKEYHEKIFTPYFTTKISGSGLGLATSFSIVRNHFGLLTYESQVGKGSIFKIYLPVIEKNSADFVDKKKKILDENEILKPIDIKSCRILVMDDDELIHRTLRNIFEKLDIKMTSSYNGKETMIKYRDAFTGNDKYDLVIMDLTIPGEIGGKETVNIIRNIDPKAKIIVSSGYSVDPVMADFEKFGFDAVMPKPYSIRKLKEIITNVLNK